MGRKPVPNDHIVATTSLRDSDEMSTFERDGRTFVSFPDDMFLYERDERAPLTCPPDELATRKLPGRLRIHFRSALSRRLGSATHRQLRR